MRVVQVMEHNRPTERAVLGITPASGKCNGITRAVEQAVGRRENYGGGRQLLTVSIADWLVAEP